MVTLSKESNIMDLRDYQERAIDKVRTSFAKGYKKTILSLPTGAGKTAIAAYMIFVAEKKGKRCGFVIDRLSLLDQTASVFYKLGIDFGIIQGNNMMTDYSKNFQICSAQTLARREMSSKFDFLIVDEAHIMYKSQLDMLKNANGTYFLGLTATPFSRGLGKYWDNLIIEKTTAEMIREGFLSNYIVYGPSKPDLKGVRISAGDYNKKDLAEKTDQKKLVGDIVEHWLRLGKDRTTVVMAVNVAHAEHICQAFKEKDIIADVIHCYLPDGQAAIKLKHFREGRIKVLCSVDMVSRGFDMPAANCLIMARPTKSLIYHIQALGRVLRPFMGKENALILDHAGNIERLGFPDDEFDMTLDMGIKNEKKQQEKKEKLPKPCLKCFFMFIGQICPACGFTHKKLHGIETKEGILEQITKTRHKVTPTEQKQKLYAKLLAGSEAAGFKDGWAANQYRNFFGTWPAKRVEKNIQFYKWLLSLDRNKMLKIIWGLTK